MISKGSGKPTHPNSFPRLYFACIHKVFEYCETCHKRPLQNRQNKGLIFFIWFDSLCPINNHSVKQGRVFLGLTSTKLELMCLAQGPQRSDAGEARAHSILKSPGSLMQVKSTAECSMGAFCNTFDLHKGILQYLICIKRLLVWKPFIGRGGGFLSGR